MTSVLMVLANGGPGGMQVAVERLALGLLHQGHDVALAIGDPQPAPKGQLVTTALGHYRSSLLGGPRFAERLHRAVRGMRPAVVHGHGLRLAPQLATLVGHAVCVTCHGLDPATARATASLVRASQVPAISCGEGPRAVLERAGLVSTVLPVGIDPPLSPIDKGATLRSLGLDPALELVVAPVRLSPQKDPCTLVDAVALVEGAALVLYGDGPLRREVEHRIAEHHLEDRCVIAPHRADLRAVLGGASALLLASRYEGHVLVALEAMAAGVPVVSTACTGVVEWAHNDVTAALAPVGDAPGLAQRLQQVLGDARYRSALVAAGLELARGYSTSAMVEAHLTYYDSLVTTRRS